MIASTSFNLPGYDPNYAHANCPYFSTRTEWAENWQGGASQVYQYTYNGPAGHEIMDPSFRRFRLQISGLVQSLSIIPSGGDNWTKKDEMTYVSDGGANLRVVETKSTAITDAGAQIKRATFSYVQRDGMWLVENKDEYGAFGIGLYRRANTTYTSYPAQYILGLPQDVSVYDGALTLLSKVTNVYDQTDSFTDSNGQSASYFIDATGDGVIQHDNANYGANFTARGNQTRVTQHQVVNGSITGYRALKRISYDTNGNVRAVTDGAYNRRQMLYTDNYSNKPAGVGQTGVAPYTAADPTGFRSGSQWDYYTGLTVKTFNLLPGDTTELQVVTTSYDFADRPLQTTRPDGGWVKTAYWDNWLAVVTSQLVETGKTRYKFEEYDGAGRARRKASDHPDGVAGKFSGQVFVFDKLGQTEDSSNVIAISGSWVPGYEDAATGFLFTHLTRDELSRLKVVTFPDNNTRQFDYTGCGCAGTSETRVTDELGHYTITKTDFLGRLIEAVEPDSGAASGIYSKASYVYDALDRLTRIDHADTTGTKIQSRYFSYDGYGRLSQENTPEAGVVNYTYTANDLPLTKVDARNITATFSYNTRNLTTGVSYSDSTPGVSFGYDSYGARSSMTDGEGTMSYVYNSFRQLQTETRTFTGLAGKQYALNYSYNLADQIKSANYTVSDSSGSLRSPEPALKRGRRMVQRQAKTKPRVANVVLRRVVPASPTAPFAVSISGNVHTSSGAGIGGVDITVTGGFGGSAVTASNGNYQVSGLANGWTYTVTPSKAGHTFNPEYDILINLNSNASGVNFTGTPPTYTISGRVTNGQGAGMSGVTITLSGTESRTATTNSEGDYSFASLTANGNYTVTPSKSGYSFAPQNRSYLNLSGNITTANFTGTALPPPPPTFNKTINYAYNSVGALKSIGTDLIGSNPNATENVLNTMTFRASGALSSLEYGNGRRLTMGYNANRQQPISMKVDRTSNPTDKIIDYQYDYYDANGKNNNRIQKVTDNIDTAYTTNYLYDNYNRLTNATAGAYTRFYQHDAWGNITNFSAVTHNYQLNASGAPATNRISSDNLGVNFSYDAAGNMTQAGATTFGYDGAGRLKSVNGTANTYGYDGNGGRARVTDGGAATFYVRSSVLKNVAMEVSAEGVRRAYLYRGSNKLVALQASDGQFYWLHTSHLGSARAMTDVNGNLVYKGQFDPYGQALTEWSSSGNTNLNTKKFTGYERDATGLDYANARMYSSGRGRFMMPDPSGVKAVDLKRPESFNRYAYVENDPVNFYDPEGLFLGNPNCLDVYQDGFLVGNTCGGVEMLLDGPWLEEPIPAPEPMPILTCGMFLGPSNYKIDDATELLAKTIFLESTSTLLLLTNPIWTSLPASKQEEEYMNERKAIAASIFNRINHPQFGSGQLHTVSDVINQPGAFAGISGGISQGNAQRIESAIQSDYGSLECSDLFVAVNLAKQLMRHYDPAKDDPFWDRGGTYAFRTTGHGAPGGNFALLPPIIGSGNTFYTLRR